MTALSDFVETFRTLDAAVWQTTSGRARISAGQLELTSGWVDDETITTRYGGEAWSVGSWDLSGSGLAFELPAANGSASAVTEAGLFTSSPRTNALLWLVAYDPTSVWGKSLKAVRRTAGVTTVVATLRPDRQAYRWLRISEEAGTVYWDTSPDGFTWEQAGSAAAPSWATSGPVRIAFGTWHTSPGDVTSVATFDSLNVDLTAGDPATLTGESADPFLAVDVQPDTVTGAFRVGTSKLGGIDKLAWSSVDPSSWVNVVCNVRAVSYRRGASREQGVLTRTEAGMGTVTVEDVAGQFDPNLRSSAIRKGTPMRIRAWGYRTDGSRWDAVLFTGELDDMGVVYLPDEDVPVVTLELVDLVGPLSAWESDGEAEPGVGAGDNLLQRVHRTLQMVGRGEVSSASSSAYTATLAPTLLAKPWDELLEAQEAELGRLWIDRHNRVVVSSRGRRPSGPIRGTLSDVHGEASLGVHCCMTDADVRHGADGLANRVLAARRKLSTDVTDPVSVRRDDALSQRLYGVATVNRQQLELQTDAQADPWAQALIVARTRPEIRVDTVTPRPALHDLDSALDAWPAVLATDLGDRWVFSFHPNRGPAILRGVGVVGIVVNVTPGGWTVTWTTEDAPVPGAANPAGWFVVGLSQLGSGDLLAPYSAPAPVIS